MMDALSVGGLCGGCLVSGCLCMMDAWSVGACMMNTWSVGAFKWMLGQRVFCMLDAWSVGGCMTDAWSVDALHDGCLVSGCFA